MKKIFLFLSLLIIPKIALASDITSSTIFKKNDEVISNKINDNNEATYLSFSSNTTINIQNEENINGLYIIYELSSQKGTINYNNETEKIGENNFLHEYIKLKSNTQNITITYDEDVKIADIYVLSEGDLPSYVEVWEPPLTNADLVLFSTHSDDEQLFFLGLLPTYVARGASVEVVYFTNHNDNPKRLHEQLHGLYTVGIRNYPIIGPIPDAWSTNLEGAISNIKKAGLTEDDALNYEVEMIRRFKPLVIVGHDEKGEYSHGQHILNTYILKKAVLLANDETFHSDSLNKYGTWDTPKLYLHLYEESQIVMDYDTPLEYFNGKTAYEVSKEGYSKHNSQQWTWFTAWINGKNNEFTKSTDIKTYSPNLFGLYRSTVGEDINKNDMFENLTLRKDELKDDDEQTTNENNTKLPAEKKIKIKTKRLILAFAIMLSAIILLLITIRLMRKKK